MTQESHLPTMDTFPVFGPNRSTPSSSKAPDRPAHPGKGRRTGAHDSTERWVADSIDRDQLFMIVYTYASNYFTRRARSEPILTHAEAEDLAGETLLEFQRHWTNIRNPEHYVRRMCRNNLFRFLKRKRQREGRESLWTDLGLDAELMADPCWMKGQVDGGLSGALNDEQLEQLRFSLECIGQADDLTQRIIMYRTSLRPMSYREIEDLTGCNEAMLRMRYARFRALVQEKYRRRYVATLQT